MNQSHLTALYNVLEQMPEGDDKELIRELTSMTFSALKFAAELEFELRTAPSDFDALFPPQPIAPEAQAAALSPDQCARTLDVLLQAGIDCLAHDGPIPHIEQIIAFYEDVIDQALIAEDTVASELTIPERDVVYAAFSRLITERVNQGASVTEIDAIYSVEDKVLGQFSA